MCFCWDVGKLHCTYSVDLGSCTAAFAAQTLELDGTEYQTAYLAVPTKRTQQAVRSHQA